MRDKGVLESVGPTFGKEQHSTEQAPLVADDGVQGVAGIVNNVQQFVQCGAQAKTRTYVDSDLKN